MSEREPDWLYKMLPELYRWRDESQGQTLRTFLGLIEAELETLETDIGAMYENWFIQTCDDWVVPYIADVLGIRNTAHGEQLPFTQRRRVANTLSYRRRKGTIAVLEQVMWDVTNWHVSACEAGRLVALTPHLRRSAGSATGSMNLRDEMAAAECNGPLTRATHTPELRRANVRQLALPPAANSAGPPPLSADEAALDCWQRATDARCATPTAGDLAVADKQAGKYSAGTVSLYFWRLHSYPVNRSRPHLVGNDPSTGVAFYTFCASGRDVPLFNRPQGFRSILQLAERANLPVPITRTALHADLAEIHRLPADERKLATSSQYYGPEGSVHIITKARDGDRWCEKPLKPKDVICGRLVAPGGHTSGDWPAPGAVLAQARAVSPHARAVIDPQRGRLAILWPVAEASAAPDQAAAQQRADQVLVNYTYAFSAEIGGGPYARKPALEQLDLAAGELCIIDVASGSRTSASLADQHGGRLIAGSLARALGLWAWHCRTLLQQNDPAVTPKGLIRILDSGSYALAEDHTVCPPAESLAWLPPNAKLAIVATNGHQPAIRGGQADDRASVAVVFEDPVQRRAREQAPESLPSPANAPQQEAMTPLVADRWLYVSGLRLVGALEVLDTTPAALKLVDITVEDCTLDGGVRVNLGNNARALSLGIARSICGPLRVPARCAAVKIIDSIIDCRLVPAPAHDDYAIAGRNPADGPPSGPPLTITRATVLGEAALCRLEAAEAVLFTRPLRVADRSVGYARACYLPAGSQPPLRCERNLHETRLEPACCRACCRGPVTPPSFTATRYGRPGYAQLSLRSAPELRHWLGDGGELGVYHNLYQPQREVNIRQAALEYLPLGCNLNVFYVT